MTAAEQPLLYWLGIVAGVLLLTPVGYTIAKRGGAERPRVWFVLHIVASVLGLAIALVHTGGNLLTWPALLFVVLAAVMAIGFWLRLRLGPDFAARMAARPRAFTATDPARRDRLRALIERKVQVLSALDPGAAEAEFSPNVRHWLSAPVGSFRYARLAAEERALIGARTDAGPVLFWARFAHMGLAALFVAGLAVHVVVAHWPGG